MLVVQRYLISVVVFVLVDFVWINYVAQAFYQKHIGHLLREEYLLGPAAIFYLMFLAGIMLFIIHPRAKDSYASISGYAMALGVLTYGTFDLTCLALFKGFPTIVAVVDMVWGGVLCTAVSVGTIFVSRKLGLGETAD